MSIVRWLSACAVGCAFFAPSPVFALKIKPESEIDGVVRTLTPRPWWGKVFDIGSFSYMENFTHGEHERVMQITWGCPQDADCDADTLGFPFAPPAALAGVRWNDNPPFELVQTGMSQCAGRTIALPNFAECWYKVFSAGEKRARKGEFFDQKSGAVIMLRSHFGDLQFLHSMAAKSDETAAETRDKILMWAEFTWRTARGEYSLGTPVAATGVPAIQNYFSIGETVQSLFTRGNPTHRRQIDAVALGALLHTLHDSFTRSHTDRDDSDGSTCGAGLPERPGKIRQFLNYTLQKSSKHSVEDQREAVDLQLQTISPNMVDVGKYLKGRWDAKATWDEVKPYLQCVFEVQDPTKITGPGRFAL